VTERGVERKLVAVLFADVVGYSRLMQLDEEGTHARVSAVQRELLEQTARRHRGRIVKNTGDGALVEFASVVDATRCAIEIQRNMIDKNANVPEHLRILFRIGINLGDVIVSRDDIFGDGVNVAARLEGLAEPGGLCISGTVFEHVRDKIPYPFDEKGEYAVKNIARPVQVFSLGAAAIERLPAFASPDQVEVATKKIPRRHLRWAAAGAVALVLGAAGVWLSRKPPPRAGSDRQLSMVVLPFVNLSGDVTQEYLADAITEGLTTDLSRINGAFVIARSTAFTYKGKPVDVKQIGTDLGVRYALEGSAQSSRGTVRVNAQLIDAESGAHIWADQFDADRSDLLDMQDQIVTRLARALSIELVDAEISRVKRTRPANLDSQDFAMRCSSSFMRAADFEDLAATGKFCEHALQIDDRNELALGLTAIMAILPVIAAQSTDPVRATKLADQLAAKALAIDPNNSAAHDAKAWGLMAQGRHEEAIIEAERSLALNPSNIDSYLAIGIANNFLCRPDQSIAIADKAARLSPRDPHLWAFYEVKGEGYFIKQQDSNAIEWLRKELAIAPRGDAYGLLLLASALALNGQLPEANEALKSYLASSLAKSRTIAEFHSQQLALANSPKWLAYNERINDGLRKAGMPEQ